MGKKIEHIDFSIHSTFSFNNIFEFDKLEFAVIYADDGISGTNTKKLTMWLTQLYSCSSIYATILIIQSFIFIHSFFCFSNQG